MNKGRLIAENCIPGNRDKSQGTAWHLEELQVVGHAQCPNHKSESYETHSEKGQQGYTAEGLSGRWDFILQTTWRLVNADEHNEEARKQWYSIARVQTLSSVESSVGFRENLSEQFRGLGQEGWREGQAVPQEGTLSQHRQDREEWGGQEGWGVRAWSAAEHPH